MSLERIRLLVERFRRELGTKSRAERTERPFGLDPQLGVELLESMLFARHLDRAAHELRARGHGHYTICSSGHEGNVVFGRLTKSGDPTLVHYRSAALYVERARGVPGVDPVRDIALGLVASREEPTSGGRHKVFGSAPLGIIPQTSTIASHLPRAAGLAFALDRGVRLGLSPPTDAIAFASFGDASVNHSTALGALNAASWVAHQNLKLPLLCVCEDNGLGISVRTPPGWVRERLRAMPHFRVFWARGWDITESYTVAAEAVRYCREQRSPAIVHLECVRLLGHAGSDVDTTYRTAAELEQALERDPVLCHARALLASAGMHADDLLELDASTARRVDAEADRAATRPRLTSRTEIASALLRRSPPAHGAQDGERATQPSLDLHLAAEPLTLAQGINRSLGEILRADATALVFGEDVAKKGGVYGITKGLFEEFGALRVFNTLLDEQTILGLALGVATLGMLPIPEIQYLAYVHNAEDQLRGEAASLSFFSNGAYDNPMIVRIAGLAYQKGFGGHFHNDNALAVLRDIPGLIVAIPARADDALAIYRCLAELAQRAGRVAVVVEPIALYHRRDLLEGDGAWLARDLGEVAAFGRGRVYRENARDLLIVTYGNGVYLSLRAAESLQRNHGVHARVLDLRWIAPLPEKDVLEHAAAVGAVLIVDECRRSGSPSEALCTLLLEASYRNPVARVTAADCFIPLGEAAELVLVSEAEIVEAAQGLAGARRASSISSAEAAPELAED